MRCPIAGHISGRPTAAPEEALSCGRRSFSWAALEGLHQRVCSGSSKLQQVSAVPNSFEQFPALPAFRVVRVA
eukprot:15466907-Alexandrium_andersonii.AAC.1